VTVEWHASGQAVMRATYVHGSPYIYFDVLSGDAVINTLRADGGEKGVFHQADGQLGVWTSVAGNYNAFLVVADSATSFTNVDSNRITLTGGNGQFTLALLPASADQPPQAEMIADFARLAVGTIDSVEIGYEVSATDQQVTVTHRFIDANGEPVNTYMGMHPLHWKHAASVSADYQVRSARGVVKWVEGSQFSYQLPFVGVLPSMPSQVADLDSTELNRLIAEYVDAGEAAWNPLTDTYWSGKAYGKAAELAAIAQQNGNMDAANRVITWLKSELADWFTAFSAQGEKDHIQYFVYDKTWHTLLGVEESFGSHQMLNDHHFHYGYFVRAAAEICRHDRTWCSQEQYGPMIELLIRDYAAGRDDPLFPYLRHFDPANGFSWASGMANFARGNNNESTSEAANAYGAMVLYGLVTEQSDITERGIYLQASTAASFWQYWNNIDEYQGGSADDNNFPAGYDRITTSIIWGDGAVFSTWFSPLYAHILGIQGLPTNPLTAHIAQYPAYLHDYINVGLSESNNGRPSGLGEDQWRDIWWNIMAMSDADAAIQDYQSMPSYTPEFGESKAHTYHWLHTWKALGHLYSGNGDITADSPAAMVFDKNGEKTYASYNFSTQPQQVAFSDGTRLTVQPNSFGVITTSELALNDSIPPSAPSDVQTRHVRQTQLTVSWTAATDNYRVAGYLVTVRQGDETLSTLTTTQTFLRLQNLTPGQGYQISVAAFDVANNQSPAESVDVVTADANADLPPLLEGSMSLSAIQRQSVNVSWMAAIDEQTDVQYRLRVESEGALVAEVLTSMTEAPLEQLMAATDYQLSLVAIDSAQQVSEPLTAAFTTLGETAVLSLFNGSLASGYTLGNYPGNNESANDRIEVNNQAIEAEFVGGGNVYLIAPQVTDLSDFRDGTLEFDIWVERYGSNTDILVKMDSGWPAVSDLDLSAYGGLPAVGEWQSVSIPVADFINSNNRLSPADKMDISNIINPIVFENQQGAGDMYIRVRNIRFSGG